ncbi:50S ribosomal protein L18 [Patescibacteria group bacterium]|nr:50S ribosomal protein L18 [Patescibacteria group bacterium]
MKKSEQKLKKRTRRHAKIRSTISGTTERPRLSVYKSNKHISVQLIDDENSVTLASAHSRDVKGKTMTEKASLVGEAIAKKAGEKNVKTVVFDRGGFIYTGNVKAVADGARKGGLKF